MDRKKVVIYSDLSNFSSSPLSNFIKYIKLESWSANHDTFSLAREMGKKVFLNILAVDESVLRYAAYKPDVITVSSLISTRSIEKIRDKLPETKIALVDVPPDMHEAECRKRNGMNPGEKIRSAISMIEKLLPHSIDMYVCGASDLKYLKDCFDGRLQAIVPIEDGGRTTTASTSLLFGADLIIVPPASDARKVVADIHQRL